MSTPTGTPIKDLRPDTYSVSVSKEGFIPEPASRIVRLKSGDHVELSFQLKPQPPSPPENQPTQAHVPPHKPTVEERPKPPFTDPTPRLQEKAEQKPAVSKEPEQSAVADEVGFPQGSLRITTQPDRGKIYVDEIFKGVGLADLTGQRLGEVVVRFGELDGYRTPAPQKVFLSPDKPSVQVEGLYLPIIFISAALDGSGRTVTQKSNLNSGYVMDDAIPRPDAVAGPEIKYLEETKAFAWEMGTAFTNRNPPGQDFIEISFDLPERFDGVKPLELRLYGYASDKRFPFTAGGRTGFDVIVNDRTATQNLQPASQLGKSRPGFDAVSINNYLRPGENALRVQTSGSSRCYYYLYKIVIM
jgi:hypothetical protein